MAGPSFAALLKAQRLARGLTQAELAQRAGISARAVSDLERGVKQRPHRDTVERLAHALALDELQTRQLLHSYSRARGAAPHDRGTRPPHVLPSPASSFLGRERQVAELTALLGSGDARLVTLTGPGGVGKSRLALRAAVELLGHFPDGVYFVSLAHVADAAQVPVTILRALGLAETTDLTPQETLTGYLRDRRVLLLLDNFERVLAAALFVAESLQAAPGLKILVTSRRRLDLSGEFEMVVPPLTLPARSHAAGQSLSASEAVALFLERARAAQLDFRLTEENGRVVAEICSRLDGLPLAIELAAANVRRLSAGAILARLSSRLALLQGGPRDVPERHRALRAAMDWSYELLAEEQRRVFSRLSVFAGGCSLEAAEAVCMLPGEKDLDPRRRIDELRDNSLVQTEVDAGGTTRVVMLDTIREYAAEHLRARGERDRIEMQHTAWFRALAQQAGTAIRRSRDPDALDRLDRERDNLALVLERTLRDGDVETAGQVAGALAPFWRIRAHYREGKRWLDSVLQREAELPAETLALTLLGAAEIAFSLADYARVREAAERALDLYHAFGDDNGAAEALNRLGLTAWEQGDPDAAIAFHRESLRLREASNNLAGVGASLGNLGTVAHSRGDLDTARDYFSRSIAVLEGTEDAHTLALEQGNLGAILMDLGRLDEADAMLLAAQESFDRLGDPGAVAFALSNRGLLALARGEYSRARGVLEEALAICREIDEPPGEARALYCLADVALHEDDPQGALPPALDALAIFARLDHGQGITFTLEAIACALAASDPATALRLFGAAQNLRAEQDAVLVEAELERHDHYAALAAGALPVPRGTLLLEEGSALSRDEAVRLALSATPDLP